MRDPIALQSFLLRRQIARYLHLNLSFCSCKLYKEHPEYTKAKEHFPQKEANFLPHSTSHLPPILLPTFHTFYRPSRLSQTQVKYIVS